jgi:hypothetical protein
MRSHMGDRGQMQELTGAVGLGLLAADTARALGRSIHSGQVLDADRPVLERARALLASFAAPADAPTPRTGLRQLATTESALDVLSAIEMQAAEADLDEFLPPLSIALEEALHGAVEKHRESLTALRQLFVSIGDAEVARVSQLSRPRAPSALLQWRT